MSQRRVALKCVPLPFCEAISLHLPLTVRAANVVNVVSVSYSIDLFCKMGFLNDVLPSRNRAAI